MNKKNFRKEDGSSKSSFSKGGNNKKGKKKYVGNKEHHVGNTLNNNPPSDYYPSPEIQKLAAAINLNFRNGDKVHFADGVNLTEASMGIHNMPGVAANAIGHVPSVSNSPTSALNEATRSCMNRIREQINANRDYEMPDLGKYILAVADLYGWIEFLKKVYRTVKKFNVLNRYTPSALLRGMRVDTSDVNNLGIQLKFYINTLVLRVKNLRLPKDIPLTTTWIGDFTEIYVDQDLAKAQYITNVPLYILKYTIDSSTGKSKLIPKTYFDAPYTFAKPAKVQDLIDFTEDLLTEILNDEDFAIITGDLMRSYSSFYELEGVGDDDVIEFHASDEFLLKWHNSCQYGRGEFNRCSGWEITEDTTSHLDPFLVFDPIQTDTTDAQYLSTKRAFGNRVVDFYNKDVSDDEIINSTLWMYTREEVDGTARKSRFRTLNTTICSNIDIITYYKDNLEHFELNGTVNWKFDNNQFTTLENYQLQRSLLLQKFNYAPIMVYQVTENTVNADDVGFFGFMGDFGNYTILDPTILKNIMTCIVYGQFNVAYLLRG